MSRPAITVQRVHFEDFGGEEFERLVFAFLWRTERWRSLEWYGQVGSDLGRDIWGTKEDDRCKDGLQVCVQCANRKRVTLKKVTQDISKATKGPNGRPDHFLLVTGSKVSATFRDKIRKSAERRKVWHCEVWSGPEFEERLRSKAESLLERFVNGEPFPDSPDDIKGFLSSPGTVDDSEILALMSELFDRPAFYTPFSSESSAPAFRQAITDTIEALNTGVRRLRDGTEIGRIPSRHKVKDAGKRKSLAEIVKMLSRLRASFDRFVKKGEIRHCQCGDPDCPIYDADRHAAREMDRLRDEILGSFRGIAPSFEIAVGRGW